LLLLRSVIALSVLVQGGLYFREGGSAPATWLAGLAALLSGAFLLIGFLTPIAGIAVGLGAIGVRLSLLGAGAPTLFDSRSAIAFAVTMLIAIVLLGPGAFSLDARVFGRREIIIPRRISASER
jgi:uncharacterized membrane protein YphA (DoxX/SURF4 family)